MEVNVDEVIKYALGGAAAFSMIAIILVILCSKSRKRRLRKRELAEKKKEEQQRSEVTPQKILKETKKAKQKVIQKEKAHKLSKKEVKVLQKEVQPVAQAQEIEPEAQHQPEVVQEEKPVVQPVVEKQVEAAKVEKLGQKVNKNEPIYLAFYKMQTTGKEGNVAFCLEKELNIGRDREVNEWFISDDATVSSRHCRIYQEDGGVYIQDLGSTNGTYVNNERIVERVKIENHDKIRIGCSEYRIKC